MSMFNPVFETYYAAISVCDLHKLTARDSRNSKILGTVKCRSERGLENNIAMRWLLLKFR